LPRVAPMSKKVLLTCLLGQRTPQAGPSREGFFFYRRYRAPSISSPFSSSPLFFFFLFLCFCCCERDGASTRTYRPGDVRCGRGQSTHRNLCDKGATPRRVTTRPVQRAGAAGKKKSEQKKEKTQRRIPGAARLNLCRGTHPTRAARPFFGVRLWSRGAVGMQAPRRDRDRRGPRNAAWTTPGTARAGPLFYRPGIGRVHQDLHLDEANMVTSGGLTRLDLQVVEEPHAPNLKFRVATPSPEKVIPEIKSRTHHLPVRLVAVGAARPA